MQSFELHIITICAVSVAWHFTGREISRHIRNRIHRFHAHRRHIAGQGEDRA